MRTGFVVIGLTNGVRPLSVEALKTATHAFTAQFTQPPASDPRFVGYLPQQQPGICLARYEATFTA